MHSTQNEKHNLKEFFIGNYFLNLIYEGILCKFFYLNKDTVSIEKITNKKFNCKWLNLHSIEKEKHIFEEHVFYL